jgi:dopamine receptor D2
MMPPPGEWEATNFSASPALVEAPERNMWALGLLLIPLATLSGNSLVIASVATVRWLRRPVNFFILGLAVADLLVAVGVMPFAVYVEVS